MKQEECKLRMQEIIKYYGIKHNITKTNKIMKQTAVEWLIETHFGSIENCTPDFRNKIKQAKEMEEQQQGYSEEELEVAFFEGRENNLPFTEWFKQFKKK